MAEIFPLLEINIIFFLYHGPTFVISGLLLYDLRTVRLLKVCHYYYYYYSLYKWAHIVCWMGVFVFKDILLPGSIIQLVWVKMIKSFLQIKMENSTHDSWQPEFKGSVREKWKGV